MNRDDGRPVKIEEEQGKLIKQITNVDSSGSLLTEAEE